MMPGRRALGAWITRASDLPLLGSVLYRLNVNAPVVRMMARGHVYSDPNWLIGERFKQKMAVTRAPGARYASIRFVTGMLDLVSDRPSFAYLCFMEPRRRGGQKQSWKRSWSSHRYKPKNCHTGSLLCTRNFPRRWQKN
jgi:hypothetical protein